MDKIFRLIIILIALSNQVNAQTVKIRERAETDSHLEAKDASFYTKNQIQIDPLWMIRGTVMFSAEKTLGDLFSVRGSIGMCFRDFMDGVVIDGPLSGSVNYVSNTPQLAYGLEWRYYYNENASFDSDYMGLGVTRRSYQYATISSYTDINNQYLRSTAFSKCLDLYVRYGSTLTISEWKKSSLLLDYGISAGFSIDEYSFTTIDGAHSENSFDGWLLPHAGLGFTF